MKKPIKVNKAMSKSKTDVCIDYCNRCQVLEVGELWDADPNCIHELDENRWNGVKCKKCSGWFCY